MNTRARGSFRGSFRGYRGRGGGRGGRGGSGAGASASGGAAVARDDEGTALAERFERAQIGDDIDERLGFARVQEGPLREGWLINMHPVRASHTFPQRILSGGMSP
jgi:DNA polymerase epsilon subunit 1